uniref:Uncharacterized protein n=1 Tax=Meloidogyne enterolobii TaxID=390850 RepID=A0A6V7WX98_MELEN|nr:unnamed protein product [Meloidogyne enterolobii]
MDNSKSKYVFGGIGADIIALASKKNSNGESGERVDSKWERVDINSRLRLELICALFAAACQKWCNVKYLNFSKETCNWLDMESGDVELKMIKAFNVIILRCAVYLKSLRLCYGVRSSSFVGRHFYSLSSLTHFSMEEPIDVWDLNRIEEFLAPNLLSLGLVLQPVRFFN